MPSRHIRTDLRLDLGHEVSMNLSIISQISPTRSFHTPCTEAENAITTHDAQTDKYFIMAHLIFCMNIFVQ